MVRSLVLTGGPCAGKTTVLSALQETYGDRIVLMPEVPTLLLANGFPRPGLDVPPSDEWFRAFQRTVLPVQENMEDQYRVMAEAKRAELLVFDRGLIDGAAYMPGGEEEYLQTFQIEKPKAYARYDAVIHLESVASCSPDLWESLKASNPARHESSLDEAKERDLRLRQVWEGHPNWHLVVGSHGIDQVISGVLELVSLYLP